MTRRRPLPSSTKPCSPPVPRKKISNPYANAKKKIPPPPDSPDSVIELPGAPPSVRLFRLPTAEESSDDDDDTGNTILHEGTEFRPPSIQLQPTINRSTVPNLPPAISSIASLQTNDNGDIDFTSIQPSTKEFTLRGILQSIADNPINFLAGSMKPIEVSELSKNSKTYDIRKAAIEKDFFQVLANHPTAAPLAEMIDDPVDVGNRIYRLYFLTRSPKAPHKRRLLNWTLLIYSLVHIKVAYRGNKNLSTDPILYAQAQYEPNTVANHFRMLFASFSKRDVNYSQASFTGKGMFAGDFRCSFVEAVTNFRFISFSISTFQENFKPIGNTFSKSRKNTD